MADKTDGGLRPPAGRQAWRKVLLAVIAAPAALLAAQPDVVPTWPSRLNSPLPTTPRIEPIIPATPRIIPRPGNDAPHIESAPIGTDRITPSEPGERQLQKELQRLQAQAETPRGAASTVQAAQASWLLGLIYLHGAGVHNDPPQAQLWFERSVRSGREPWAYAGLAWCLTDGCTGPSEPAAAARAIARLRPYHPARADFLSWLLAARFAPDGVRGAQGIAPRQTEPIPQLALLQRSAAAGDSQALIELGIIAFSNQQWPQAEAYFRRAAPRSVVAAHNLKVVQARSGTMSAPVTPVMGSAQAALNMARMYHRGQGVPANFSEAVRFYRLAEQRGSKEARQMLELIFSRPMPDGSLNPAWMQQLANADTSAPAVTMGSGVNAPQMQREPTPLFDLLTPFWQQQVQPIAP